MSDGIQEFQEIGEGLYLYFFYLKFFGILFTIILILSIPSLVLNIKGSGLQA